MGKILKCKVCNKEFESDARGRTKNCSIECRVKSRTATNMARYGKASLTKVRSKESYSNAAKKAWADNKAERVANRNKTMLDRYGVKSLGQNPGADKKRKETLLKTYGTTSSRLVTTIQTAGFSNFQDFANAIISRIKELGVAPYSDTFKAILVSEFKCTYEVLDSVLALTDSKDLLYTFKSTPENEIAEFLDSLGVVYVRNRRPNFMDGLELDFYIEDLNFAIEYHGLAFHSDRPIYHDHFKSDLHKIKYERCLANNVKLLQIFEDEWRDKPEILKSMIRSRLNMSQVTVFGRKTEVKAIQKSEADLFLANTHIAGSAIASYHFGLYHNSKLISVISFRKPWTKAYGDSTIEIARFASELGYSIPGGFSKLMNLAIPHLKSAGFTKILTYADLRFGVGNVYRNYGFEFKGTTKPNYFYEKAGIRESRFSHRKNNDPDFIAKFGNSEKEQNNNQGWFAIYDAGSNIFTLDLK